MQDRDLVASLQQSGHKTAADKQSAANDENTHAGI
jgi:hypothetical protein